MNYLLLLTSVVSVVIRNSIFNGFAVKNMKTRRDNLRFNGVMYIFCFVAYSIMAIQKEISLGTILMGCVYGIMTVLFNMSTIQALSLGPMHITSLITTSSMIIPTVFGTFLAREPFSTVKLLFLLLLIGCIFLGTAQKHSNSIGKNWGWYCLAAFLSSGMLGVLQKLHQVSNFGEERAGFLGAGFLCAFLLTGVSSLGKKQKLSLTVKHYLAAIGCGACVFVVNYLTMVLVAVIPSQVFFPAMNGGAILLTAVSSVLLFKEPITRRQLIGLCGGIGALICICVM